MRKARQKSKSVASSIWDLPAPIRYPLIALLVTLIPFSFVVIVVVGPYVVAVGLPLIAVALIWYLAKPEGRFNW